MAVVISALCAQLPHSRPFSSVFSLERPDIEGSCWEPGHRFTHTGRARPCVRHIHSPSIAQGRAAGCGATVENLLALGPLGQHRPPSTVSHHVAVAYRKSRAATPSAAQGAGTASLNSAVRRQVGIYVRVACVVERPTLRPRRPWVIALPAHGVDRSIAGAVINSDVVDPRVAMRGRTEHIHAC